MSILQDLDLYTSSTEFKHDYQRTTTRILPIHCKQQCNFGKIYVQKQGLSVSRKELVDDGSFTWNDGQREYTDDMDNIAISIKDMDGRATKLKQLASFEVYKYSRCNDRQ